MPVRAHEERVGFVERLILREEQVAQVPRRRCEVRIDRQRVLECVDRFLCLILLLEEEPLVVERASRSRADAASAAGF